MKLLFDENLSPRLARLLEDIFPLSTHVREVGLQAAADPLVWDYAKDNGMMLVSKDSDMHQRSFLLGQPPKVVWVRLGNCSTSEVADLLRRNFASIQEFHENREASFLSLSRW
jgi:predicted nuclease of predicted toxin-antitoxin system